MIKKIILTSLVIAQLLLILGIAAMLILAETYPFQPGELLYPVQHTGEQARLSVTNSRSSRANFALVLAERRLADLAQANTPAEVQASVQSFENALKTTATALDKAPQGAHAALYEKLGIILAQADVVVHTLGDRVDLALLQDLHSRIRLTEQAGSLPEMHAILLGEIPAEIVPFYPQDVDHSKFGLFGGHYSVDCMSCHQNGEYASVSNECSSCHQPKVYEQLMPEVYGNRMVAYQGKGVQLQASQLYPEHYAGECSDCHSIYNWDPIAFDHLGVFECLSCHSQDIPADRVEAGVLVTHYPGDCRDCHSSFVDWQITEYGHEGVQECLSCHADEAHETGSDATCSSCHKDVSDWTNVAYDHTNQTDCSSCHSLDAPQDHYGGQCSNCHNTDDWTYGVIEHPSGANCLSCHDKPANHYKDSCSSCHNPNSGNWEKTQHTGNQNCTQCHSSPGKHYAGVACTNCHTASVWTVSSYDHTKTTLACTDCHEKKAPAAHYQSACQDCHSTTNWGGWVFNHNGYTACKDCHLPNATSHYAGACSDCHNTSDWVEIEVDHTYMYDCLSCHTIDKHWPGQCSSCHVVDDWQDIDFDHTNYTDCKACHVRPQGHPRKQCSNCHNTDYWIEPTATPVPSATPGTNANVILPLPPEDEQEFGLPPEWVPFFTPKPTSTPVLLDERPTPTTQPTQQPRDSELTPTPEPSQGPGTISTPAPDPIDPNPVPAPAPNGETAPESTPSPPASQVESVAVLPEEHKLLIEPELQTAEDGDEDQQAEQA